MKKILTLFFAVFLFFGHIHSQDEPVDLMEMVNDMQKWSKDESRMKMVWWIPTIYWKVSNQGNSNVTEQDLNEMMRVFEDYTVVAVLDGKIGAFGIYYEEAVDITLYDEEGNAYQTIDEEDIHPETKYLLDVLKPVMGNTIGQMGENMIFLVFPSKKKDGSDIIDPVGEGSFSITYNEEDFKWKTPLGSLIPKKVCPEDGEELNGSWKFCPHHGEELVEKEEIKEKKKVNKAKGK